MTRKQYVFLLATVFFIGSAAYFSQKEFLNSTLNNSVRGGDTSLGEESPLKTLAAPNATSTTSNIVSIPIRAEGTVLEAMQEYASNSDFAFSGREHPSLGFFVESINGKKNADGKYWILYVNGEQSQKGASQTAVKPNDKVEWRLEESH